MADRYNNINNTSPYETAMKNSNKTIPMSNFDYGMAHYGNMNIGKLEILDCFETLPRGSYTLGMDLLIKVRAAMKKRIFTGQRVYVHAYYMSLNDLWEGAQNHIDHGRSGLLDIEKPYTDGFIHYTLITPPDIEDITPYADICTPNSPINQLGIPARKYAEKKSFSVNNPMINAFIPADEVKTFSPKITTIQNFSTKINALPLAMYQRIYLDKYAPKNLLQNNKNAYPDNAEKIRIGYNVTLIDSLSANGGEKAFPYNEAPSIADFDNPSSYQYILDKDNSDNYPTVQLGLPRFRQKKGTYFTTSSPFADLLRGDAPTIDLAGFSANVDFSDVIKGVYPSSVIEEAGSFKIGKDTAEVNINMLGTNLGSSSEEHLASLISILNQAKVNGNVQTTATANMLRTLISWTLIKERNALTNGDYNAMVKAQFGYSPNVDDYGPKYIGGFYQDMVFSDVTQTSESSDSSPMGYQVGQAMSANTGFIGKFTAPDYGYIMIIASIVPDEIYAQGIPRYLSDLSSDDVYTSPLLNNLPPQAIKYKELFLTSTEAANEDVFSYTQRHEHLRHRENRASGFLPLKSIALEDSSYIQFKPFTSTPEFNAKYVTLCPDNVDMSVYDVTTEPPYIFAAISKVDKVEPLPYDSLPADFGFNF